jgi:transposase-like protein
VINVDKNPAYPAAVEALKEEGVLPGRVRLRQCNTVKKRTWLAKGYGSFLTAWLTLQGIEAVNMIRKGRARWVEFNQVDAAEFLKPIFRSVGPQHPKATHGNERRPNT